MTPDFRLPHPSLSSIGCTDAGVYFLSKRRPTTKCPPAPKVQHNILFSTPQTRQQIIAIVRSLGSFCCSFDNEESRDLL